MEFSKLIQIMRKTNFHALDHTPQHKVLNKKVKSFLIQSQNQDILRYRIYERRILRIIETNKI